MITPSLFLLAMMSQAKVSLQNAQQALDQGQYQQAAELYQEVLQESEQPSYEALYGRARALAFAGDYTAALSAYNTLLEHYPQDPDALLGRGRVLGWMQRYSEAESDLKQILAAHPDYTDAWQALADIYRWSHNEAALADHLKAWQKQDPNSPQPYLALARFELDQRHFTAAREALIAARQRHGDAETLQRLMARLNLQPGALPWEAQFYYEWQGFVGDRSPWHNLTSGLRYSFDQGTVTLQGLGAYRFDRWDQAAVVDSFLELWPGAYTNVRIQGAWPAEVLPRWDVLGEVYQGFADTWEASAAYRIMNYSSGSNVHFFQGSLAKYLGNWYLRFNPMLFLSDEGPGASLSFWTRYYYGTVDDFVELRLGLGRRLAVVASDNSTGPTLQGQSNFSALLSGQHFFTPQFGLVGSLNYNYDELFNDRYGLNLGTRIRW